MMGNIKDTPILQSENLRKCVQLDAEVIPVVERSDAHL
jgi:hypothetical protein